MTKTKFIRVLKMHENNDSKMGYVAFVAKTANIRLLRAKTEIADECYKQNKPVWELLTLAEKHAIRDCKI